MMSWLAFTCVSIGLVWLVQRFTQIDFRIALPVSFAGVISILNLGALAGLLPEAWTLLVVSGGLSFAVSIGMVLRSGAWTRQALIRSPAVLYSITSLLLFFMTRRLEVYAGDELAHWALVAKELYFTDALPAATSNVIFKDYPEGAGLLQYFFARFSFQYLESNLFYAQALFLISTVYAVIAPFAIPAFEYGKARWTALILLIVGAGFYFKLAQSMFTLMVDQLIACLFALAVVSGSVDSQKPKQRIPGFGAILICFTLPFIKKPAFLLALIAGACVLVNFIWNKQSHSRRRIWILTLALTIAPVTSHCLWSAWVTKNGFAHTFNSRADTGSWRSVLDSEKRSELQTEIIRSFGSALVWQKVGRVNGVATWIMSSTVQYIGWIFISAAVLMAFANRRTMGELLSQQIVVTAGGLAYFGGLLWLYIFSFSAYEGPRLASFDRYAMIYILAWILLLIGRMQFLRSLQPRSVFAVAVILLLVLGVSTPWHEAKLSLRPKLPMGLQTVRDVSTVLGESTPKGSRILLLVQGSTGEEVFAANYALAPDRKVNVFDFWWVVRSEGQMTPWSTVMTGEQFRQRLLGYDFVYLYKLDSSLCRDFGDVIEAGDCLEGSLLQVQKSAGQFLGLKRVERLGVI